MISLIGREYVDKKHWISKEEMVDMIAISESLPGAIAINTSIAVGYKLKGFKGALTAVLGVITPCILIITIVTYLYNSVPENSPVWLFVRGVRAGVVGLMVEVVLDLGSGYMKDAFSIIMFIGAFSIAMFTNFPVILIVLTAGLIGFIYGKINKSKQVEPHDAD